MTKNIDTIFYDVGSTLRLSVDDPEFSRAAKKEMMELLGITEPMDEFFKWLDANHKKYRDWTKVSFLDHSEAEQWMFHMMPDYPDKVKLAELAPRLTTLYRDADGRRISNFGAVETVTELNRRGYKQGIIANTITETEIPNWAIEEKIIQYFGAIIPSGKVRIRKPDPAIYLLAARVLDSKPENCVYVGDNPKRDIDGTFDAGFGMMILIKRTKPEDNMAPPKYDANYRIEKLTDLLDIFPPR